MRQGDTTQSTAKAPEEFAAACLDSLWKELLHRDQFTNMNSLLLKISRQRFASPCFSAYAASSSDSVGDGGRPRADSYASVTCSWRAFASDSSRAAKRSAECRSEEHTSELQSQSNLVCRLLLEKK